MSENLAQKLISNRLIDGRMSPGEEIALKIDQTLAQDATGTLVMLEFEATGLPRVKTELSAQYVDHNLLQLDYKNPDDHLFLRSACQKFGVYYSPPGNGVSHPVHMERFGVPGKSLIGSDSHTPAAGALAMLSFGAGGLEVAMAMAGEPFYLKMPKIVGVRLTGRLPDWVSAKDVILEMLRRYDVDGGRGRIFEYYGPGLNNLTVMDRHVIANMGTEMGATTSVFPSDERVREFLKQQGRPDDFQELAADADARYDETVEVNLSELEPLIARPSSPGNVVPVREEAGNEIYQAYIGSSANPGLRDFAVPALMVRDRAVHDRVSFDINPSSRRVLTGMIQGGHLESLVAAGARIHQAGCNGCIGMGQAPATGRNSLRTVPRNFPGRSGVSEDRVFLCSPETAAASALTGTITDPRTLDQPCPRFEEPERLNGDGRLFVRPREGGESIRLEKGPNIASFPKLSAMPGEFEGPLLLKMGDNISTDEILPAGSNVLPFRSNIPEISKFCFQPLDESFHERARRCESGSIFLLGGDNYGQGSSREHAALAPRFLGVRVVIAKSFARIHRQNLVNFGILPLRLREPTDWEELEQDDTLAIENVREAIGRSRTVRAIDRSKGLAVELEHDLSPREIDIVKNGGLVNLERECLASK